MITDIRAYDAKRKKRSDRLDVERRPSGAVKRFRDASGPLVYFIQIQGGSYVKIGCTKNVQKRVADYEWRYKRTAHCLMQIVVETVEQAKALESEFLIAASKVHPKIGREWFVMSDEAIRALVESVLPTSQIKPICVRGAPALVPTRSAASYEIREASAMTAQRNALRRVRRS